MVAHAIGESRAHHSGVRGAVRMGLWASAIITRPLFAVLLATRPILLAVGEDPRLAADAGRFMSTLCFGPALRAGVPGAAQFRHLGEPARWRR